MSGYWKRFLEWQNYAHYLLLDLIVSFTAFYFGAPIGLKMFFILYLALFIGDSIVHGILWILPRPLRWRD